MTTTGVKVVYERIPALPTTHYEFELASHVHCILRDSCWVVQFDANLVSSPMIYAFGEPDEPIEDVAKVFFEAVCAGWCGALYLARQVRCLDEQWERDGFDHEYLPPHPDARNVVVDSRTEAAEELYPPDGAEVWTGDEVKAAVQLLSAITCARRRVTPWTHAHHKGYDDVRSVFRRQDIMLIADYLRERYAGGDTLTSWDDDGSFGKGIF